jgi:hypothetical protein
MPRSFDVSADYEGSVEDVHRALREPEYWRARLVNSAVDDFELESMRVEDCAIEVAMLQVMFSKNLPALVTQLHRGDLRFTRTETWGPVTDGAVQATLGGSIANAPLSLSGTGDLSPTAEGGSRLKFLIEVHVRIPIIGGKVEKLVGAQLPAFVKAEQHFTDMWIKDHA